MSHLGTVVNCDRIACDPWDKGRDALIGTLYSRGYGADRRSFPFLRLVRPTGRPASEGLDLGTMDKRMSPNDKGA